MDAAAMSVIAAGILVLILLAADVYIGVTLGISAIIGTYLFTGSLERGISLILHTTVSVTTTYGFLVIPLFILLGMFASHSGIAADLFRTDYRWVGHIPGGLAITTVITCAGMAAITGTSLGTVAAMIRIALPEMRKYKYSENLSVGVISVAGTLAIMIPPSVTFVLYAIFAEQSIGKLLISGILPGLVLAALYSILILTRCWINPSLGPPAAKFSWRERWVSLLGVAPFFTLLIAIFLGIILGIWTPVESSAVGVVIVFFMALFRHQMTFRKLLSSLTDAVVTTASIMVLVVGCMMFSKFLSLTGFNETLTDAIINLKLSPFVLFSLLVLIYTILGMFLEATSIIALTVPLMMPVVKAVGWDPIWFGVFIVCMMEVASVTPPVGLVLYTVKASAPEIPIETIMRGCVPFWLCNIVAVFMFYFVPQICLLLPSLMKM